MFGLDRARGSATTLAFGDVCVGRVLHRRCCCASVLHSLGRWGWLNRHASKSARGCSGGAAVAVGTSGVPFASLAGPVRAAANETTS